MSDEPKSLILSFWRWLVGSPAAVKQAQETLQTANLFTYFDGKENVSINPTVILGRLGELARELAFTAQSPGYPKFDPEQVLKGFYWVFDMKVRPDSIWSNWHLGSTPYWTGSCYQIDQPTLTSKHILQIVESFLTQYETELHEITLDAKKEVRDELARNAEIEYTLKQTRSSK